MVQTTFTRERFLSEDFDVLSKNNVFEKEIPDYITENLNPNFELREYQKEAFTRFFHYLEKYPEKPEEKALLFNMATGSGKTLIMAGLILYLYKQGYRNFLFFVNSNNIIDKTKDNFMNFLSSKYLFNEKINIDGKPIKIREVNSFEGINENEINICFTTIQKLHLDLSLDKENSITFEDFKNKKLVLLADEAHHGQVKTKQTSLIPEKNWENTIEQILDKNKDNLLLEFTATMGFENNPTIKSKYLNRLLYKYDLLHFRNEKFSKDIELFRVDGNKEYRMLTAVLINQYRQDIASKYKIKHFKPVILFKAQARIEESKENYRIFRELIDNLKKEAIEDIKKRSNESIMKKLFAFYEMDGTSIQNLIKKIQLNFVEENCLNVNESVNLDNQNIKSKDREKVLLQQNILNSLEDEKNPIRIIFAVQKLNEGWDVLNLFDIVRVSEQQATGGTTKGRIAPSTISEAQLIGRGARYFPFKLDESQDKYKRKFDSDIENELRILEELYFHSYDESRYISDLKNALIEKGLMDDETEERELKLKEPFKKTSFYKTGKIYINRLVKKDYSKMKSFKDLGFNDNNIQYELFSGKGEKTQAFKDEKYDNSKIIKKPKTISLSKIDPHIIRNALAKISFFEFKKMNIIYPSLNSIKELISNKEFLSSLNIEFRGTKEDLENISNKDKLDAVLKLLNYIKDSLKGNITNYIGSPEFYEEKISSKFYDKTLKLNKKDPRFKSDEAYLENKEWYVFNANYGTDQERACVEFIEDLIEENLKEEYKEIYLIRNELHFTIKNFKDGRGFAPDFVLFMKSKKGKELTYQIFIEPKGGHIAEGDKWKQDFLLEIQEKFSSSGLKRFIETTKYKVIGVPFFRKEKLNNFKEELLENIKD